MSEVDVSASSPVRLRPDGIHRTWVLVAWSPLFALATLTNFVALLQKYLTPISNQKALFVAWSLFLSPIICGILCSKEWLTSVTKVVLEGNALEVSTRLGKTTIPLEGVTECEISVAKVKGRIEITLGVIPPGGKDLLKVYFIRKIDPVKDLQLLPALQRRGIRLIGTGEFQRDIERLTGKSAAGLFGASGSLEATSLN